MASLLSTLIIILVCVLVAWMLTFSILSNKYPYESKYRKWSLILPLKDKLFGKSHYYDERLFDDKVSGGDYDSLEDDDYLSYATSSNYSYNADADDDVF